MENSFRRSKSARQASPASKTALGRCLAAGLVAAGLAAAECAAAVVSIDITSVGSPVVNISGVNAGIPEGGIEAVKNVNDFPITGSGFSLWNRWESLDGIRFTGFSPFAGTFEIAAGSSDTSPFRFTETGTSSVGENLPSGVSWQSSQSRTSFAFANYAIPPSTAASWGDGSYLGFRARPTNSSTDWTYGYFEATWNAATFQFEILSGAYESTVNTPITVPEPAGLALAGIGALALAAGAIRRGTERFRKRFS